MKGYCPLFLFLLLFLVGCYYGFYSADYGNCKINFYNELIQSSVTKRGVCRVVGNLMDIKDIDGNTHLLDATAGSYRYREGDLGFSLNGTIITTIMFWTLYPPGADAPWVQVFLDHSY